MDFSVTLVFWSCVTLGFFNSVKVLPGVGNTVTWNYRTRLQNRSKRNGRRLGKNNLLILLLLFWIVNILV
jgi:hypothetical protein